MSKNDIESKPILSYINVESFELYVTYPGKLLTCKYCHEVGHVQSECEKRLADYPNLNNSQVLHKLQKTVCLHIKEALLI